MSNTEEKKQDDDLDSVDIEIQLELLGLNPRPLVRQQAGIHNEFDFNEFDEPVAPTNSQSSSRTFFKNEKQKLIEENSKLLREISKLKKSFKNNINIIVKDTNYIDKFKDDKCSICLEIEGKKIVTNCKHVFHKECIKKWVLNTCPLCRKYITENDYMFSFETKKSYTHNLI